jgi:hypothetical protein
MISLLTQKIIQDVLQQTTWDFAHQILLIMTRKFIFAQCVRMALLLIIKLTNAILQTHLEIVQYHLVTPQLSVPRILHFTIKLRDHVHNVKKISPFITLVLINV